MIYKISNFVETPINPITKSSYDDSWVVYCLTDSIDYQMMVGKNNGFVYTAKVSTNYNDWKMSVCDFIGFNEERNKNIVLSIEDFYFEEARQHYEGHTYKDAYLRENEPDVLIHSTTYENWVNIQSDKCLKSWNILKAENVLRENKPIGQELGDPIDFSDFIMFSGGNVSSEIVVLSKQNGKIIMNPDMEYKTGVRMYFDAKKIAEDGLLIRDGVHLKVENNLPLEPYLLWTATWENVGLKSCISTPKEFTKKSNDMFNQLFERKVETTY